MPTNKPFGDDPVDSDLERNETGFLRQLVLGEFPTYTTTDNKEFEKREEARDHQRWVNKQEQKR